MPATIYTIGHSTHTLEHLLSMLAAHGVKQVVDVRTVPRSRHNPQFDRERLETELPARGIGYRHLGGLGGLRRPQREGSPNTGWRDESCRGFADYMQSPAFAQALAELVALAEQAPTAVMCAEALPWRCHRSLIADALTAQGVPVCHLMSATECRLHQVTACARIAGGRVTYPAPAPEQGDLPL